MATKKLLLNQYRKCENLVVDLMSALEKLSAIASELYGKDLTACMNGGSEIEFRSMVMDMPDADDCVRIEDILERL